MPPERLPPMPPPLTTVVAWPPTKMDSVCPGVSANVPDTRPPRPPAPPAAAPVSPLPPCAPLIKTRADVTSDGTTVVCSAPVKRNVRDVSPTLQDDGTCAQTQLDALTNSAIAPSNWEIFAAMNILRCLLCKGRDGWRAQAPMTFIVHRFDS